MVRFALSGDLWRRFGLPAVIGALCLGSTAAVVIALDRQRIVPDLARIAAERTQLEQAEQKLAALPSVRPIHWQMRQLSQLAKTLPGIREFQAIEADPENYSDAVRQQIGSFGGDIWKVAVSGSFPAVIWLCRTAQPLMPLIVDSVEAGSGAARVVLLVLGATPNNGDPT